ncbi:hypothetical protein Gotur_003280 [Gossypium turneri]
MIGGNLMPDLSRNLVHLRWLLKLIDFRVAREFSWGSTVLETLYQKMCGVTPPNKAKIRGCLSLLQSWARFCFPFLRPRVNHPYTFPLITRWNHPTSYVGIPTALEDIRLLLDQLSEAQFQWTPHEDPTIRAVIPDEFFQNLNIWHVKVPLVNYTTVEMHQMDKVLRQFRFRQPILEAPEVFDKEHKIDLWKMNTNWCISFPDNFDSTDDIEAIITGGIARGTVEEIISLPIIIALWDSNTSVVGDANSSHSLFY